MIFDVVIGALDKNAIKIVQHNKKLLSEWIVICYMTIS